MFEHLVEEGNFAEPEAKEVSLALTSALAYIHSRGIIHRDVNIDFLFMFLSAYFFGTALTPYLSQIKPENVLYRTPPRKGGAPGPAGDCVLSDFGLAVDLGQNERLSTLCGSPGYSAPE